MRLTRVLLVIPVMILIALGAAGGCDGSGSGSMGDGGGSSGDPGGQATCPCFSQDDVVNTASQTTSIECANTVFGLILLYNDSKSTAYAANCKPNGTGCSCSGGSAGLQSVSQSQYNACVNNLLNGLVMFNVPTVKATGCVPE
jgi:hypothetical protein